MERPSCSTSGGQSEGRAREDVAAAGGVLGETLSLEPGAERAMAIHEETEVQERHGFPSGPSTTPFGKTFFSSSSTRWRCSGGASKGWAGNPVVISTAHKKRDKTG